jgi:hypothetical protein
MYKILHERTAYELSKSVQKAMEDGWKCQGGIQISYTTYDSKQVVEEYMQAIVKDAEVKQVL